MGITRITQLPLFKGEHLNGREQANRHLISSKQAPRSPTWLVASFSSWFKSICNPKTGITRITQLPLFKGEHLTLNGREQANRHLISSRQAPS